MNEQNYSDFSDSIHQLVLETKDRRIPIEGMLELTRLCSIKCKHCYIGESRWKKDPHELNTQEVKDLLDILEERGNLWLCITGGEAMIRPDFKEIWMYAKRKGFILTLFTNATLISESMAKFLYDNPPFNIEVSIYGASEEVYEEVSQIKGSFKRFMKGIENLRATGLPWRLKAVLIKESAHELPAMKELAKFWGVKFNCDGNINPSIGVESPGAKAPCSTRVDSEEIVEMEISIKEQHEEIMKVVEKNKGQGRGDQLYNCGAGKHSFYMNANGNLQMCILTSHHGKVLKTTTQTSKPILTQNFDQTWDYFEEVRKLKRAPNSPCRTCDIASLCESCPGFSHLENGNEQGVVEYLCRNTHLKAKRLNIPHKCDISHFVYKKKHKPCNINSPKQ